MDIGPQLEAPLVVLRMPAVAATHDHLLIDRDAMQALRGDDDAVRALCGAAISPAPSAAWCGTLCEPCTEHLYRVAGEQPPGRHRLEEAR